MCSNTWVKLYVGGPQVDVWLLLDSYWSPPPPQQTCCCRTCVNSLANFGFNMVGGPGTELTDSLGLPLKKVFWVQIQFNAFGSTTLETQDITYPVLKQSNSTRETIRICSISIIANSRIQICILHERKLDLRHQWMPTYNWTGLRISVLIRITQLWRYRTGRYQF